MQVARTEVLLLYKNLLRYSRKLTLTDPVYFRRRVLSEFKINKALDKEEDIKFAYQVKLYYFVVRSYSSYLTMFLTKFVKRSSPLTQHIFLNFKHTIDYSKVPTISELDLTEQFIRGSGPGGSAVNKNSNCVVLTHAPTGIVIKCHQSRCQDDNRKMAREQLIAKLDEIQNGADSVAAQKKRIEETKYKKSEYKKKKMAHLKSEWKKREGLS